MEIYLACPTFLAVFINQEYQYQQNEREINIMIKPKWDVKECFQKYNTNENHKIIFLQSDYMLMQNLSKFVLLLR